METLKYYRIKLSCKSSPVHIKNHFLVNEINEIFWAVKDSLNVVFDKEDQDLFYFYEYNKLIAGYNENFYFFEYLDEKYSNEIARTEEINWSSTFFEILKGFDLLLKTKWAGGLYIKDNIEDCILPD